MKLLLRGIPIRIPNHRDPNHQLNTPLSFFDKKNGGHPAPSASSSDQCPSLVDLKSLEGRMIFLWLAEWCLCGYRVVSCVLC